MQQAIISKGKSVEEAIYLGLERLDAKKSEVNIEIIQEGKQGFIGMGKQQAIVKLSLFKAGEQAIVPSVEHAELVDSIEELIDALPDNGAQKNPDAVHLKMEETSQDELLGKAWIKENKLFTKDSPNQFATVSIGKGIQLFRNKQAIREKSTVVSEKDELEIRFEPNVEVETKWDIKLDENKLHAILHVEPGYRITRKVEDVEPSEHIELTLQEVKESYNTLQYKEVLAKLDALRVNYGFNHSEIVEAANATSPETYTIATGKKTEPGKDGWVEFKVDLIPKNGLVEDEEGNIDFRNVHLIPTVEKGSIIGIIHQPLPGRPGITVTNEPLLPKQTVPIQVIAEKGIEVIDDKLVAFESGRPSVEQRGQVLRAKIVPKLLHEGNVSMETGNIRFHGDVEITGEVEENMLVEAEGDIFIHKTVSVATLTTLKSIMVKGNVIGSELNAGKNNMLVAELGHLLGIMEKQMGQMIQVIEQLTKSPAFKSADVATNGLQPLIIILLEKRFKNFLSYAKKYQEVVEKGQAYLADQAWLQVGIAIKQIFLMLSNQVTTLNRLTRLHQKMIELADMSKLPVEPNAYITIANTVNSRFYCSGDIHIIGKGCINSKVHSGGRLTINNILRGGEIYGRLGVSVKESGSTSGVKTIVAVPKDQRIIINLAHENTVLKIGNTIRTLKDEHRNILAKLNENDEIIFE